MFKIKTSTLYLYIYCHSTLQANLVYILVFNLMTALSALKSPKPSCIRFTQAIKVDRVIYN